MDDYISKPLEPKVLLNVLERWVQSGSDVSVEAGQDYSAPVDVFAANSDHGLFGEDQPPTISEVQASALVLEEIAPTDTAPVNFDMALYRFDGDRDFMKIMFKEYMDHLPGRLAEIDAAAQAGDSGRLTYLAHNLKGVSLNFSVETVADIARMLEEMGKRENLADVSVLVSRLHAEVRRLEEYLVNHSL